MRYVDKEGNKFKNDNKKDLAYELYVTSWAKINAKSFQEWLLQTAARFDTQFDIVLEFHDEESFVDELIKYNEIIGVN